MLGEQLGGAVGDALDQLGHVVGDRHASGASAASVCITLTNALFSFGAQLGVFADAVRVTPTTARWSTRPRPTARRRAPSCQSQVAAFRIGDGEFVSVPGEAFPFTYLGSFLGPNDMPNPQYALPPWVTPHMHAPYRFVDGLAEDMLGYIFPRGNGVGVPGETDSGDGTDRFGCGHSDDSEAASSQTGDVVGHALVRRARLASRARPRTSTVGRYVLPGGTLSRDPLGQPGSIKCNVDTVFHADGTGGRRVARRRRRGGHVVVPAAWMSLSGRPQARPDRNTRGWIDRDGTRHWLDVFPDPFAGGGAPRR